MTNTKRSGRRSAKPRFEEILKKTAERNEEAAVDIYARALIGFAGLVIAVSVFIFADPSEKVLGIAFLVIPVLPVAFGIVDDFIDAKKDLIRNTVR